MIVHAVVENLFYLFLFMLNLVVVLLHNSGTAMSASGTFKELLLFLLERRLKLHPHYFMLFDSSFLGSRHLKLIDKLIFAGQLLDCMNASFNLSVY